METMRKSQKSQFQPMPELIVTHRHTSANKLYWQRGENTELLFHQPFQKMYI